MWHFLYEPTFLLVLLAVTLIGLFQLDDVYAERRKQENNRRAIELEAKIRADKEAVIQYELSLQKHKQEAELFKHQFQNQAGWLNVIDSVAALATNQPPMHNVPLQEQIRFVVGRVNDTIQEHGDTLAIAHALAHKCLKQ